MGWEFSSGIRQTSCVDFSNELFAPKELLGSIGFIGPIERSPVMADDLSTHCRSSAFKSFGYIAN
jgi:hypothetical protein